MRTNIEIDDNLIKLAMKMSGAPTKKAVVEEALRMLVRIKGQAGILKLRGKVQFAEDDIETARLDDKWQKVADCEAAQAATRKKAA